MTDPRARLALADALMGSRWWEHANLDPDDALREWTSNDLADVVLDALPANVHLVVHEHDVEDVHGCRECSDALDAGREARP